MDAKLPRRFGLEGVENEDLRLNEGLRSRSLVSTFVFFGVCAWESRSRCSPELVPGRDLTPLLPVPLLATLLFPQVLVVKKAEPMPLYNWNAIVGNLCR